MLFTSLLASASLEDASIACVRQRTVYTGLEHARKRARQACLTELSSGRSRNAP